MKNFQTKIILAILFLVIAAGFFGVRENFKINEARAVGNVYYVSTNGNASWSQCININTPCSLATAVASADDDDRVYLRGGNYTSQQLAPANSGSAGHVITFARYQAETPSFTRAGASVYLSGVSYIVIDGLTFMGGTNRQLYIYNGATYNEVKNCTFSGNYAYATMHIHIASNYNYIHDNMFNAGGRSTSEVDESDSILIHSSNYNRIIGNTFAEGQGHDFISLMSGSSYNVFRKNVMTVSDYWDDSYSALDIFFGLENNSNYNIIENNMMIETGSPVGSHVPFQFNSSSFNIFRNNVANSTRGSNSIYNNKSRNSEYNSFYYNTFYDINSWYSGYAVWTIETSATDYVRYNQFLNNIIHTSAYYGFRSAQSGYIANISDNVFRNNVIYNNSGTQVRRNTTNMTLAQAEASYPAEFSGNLTLDPQFVTPGSDFSLKSGSPAIDSGAWLTTIESASGIVSSFLVDNPYYFYDGHGISGLTGDVIKTENNQKTTIQTINYDTGTIVVSPAINIEKGEGVALDYSGSAPDIGAHEYIGGNSDTTTPSIPAGFSVR